MWPPPTSPKEKEKFSIIVTRVACRRCLAHCDYRVLRLDFIALEHLDVANAIDDGDDRLFYKNY
jgi:hypothetical protein